MPRVEHAKKFENMQNWDAKKLLVRIGRLFGRAAAHGSTWLAPTGSHSTAAGLPTVKAKAWGVPGEIRAQERRLRRREGWTVR